MIQFINSKMMSNFPDHFKSQAIRLNAQPFMEMMNFEYIVNRIEYKPSKY